MKRKQDNKSDKNWEDVGISRVKSDHVPPAHIKSVHNELQAASKNLYDKVSLDSKGRYLREIKGTTTQYQDDISQLINGVDSGCAAVIILDNKMVLFDKFDKIASKADEDGKSYGEKCAEAIINYWQSKTEDNYQAITSTVQERYLKAFEEYEEVIAKVNESLVDDDKEKLPDFKEIFEKINSPKEFEEVIDDLYQKIQDTNILDEESLLETKKFLIDNTKYIARQIENIKHVSPTTNIKA